MLSLCLYVQKFPPPISYRNEPSSQRAAEIAASLCRLSIPIVILVHLHKFFHYAYAFSAELFVWKRRKNISPQPRKMLFTVNCLQELLFFRKAFPVEEKSDEEEKRDGIL